MQEVARGIALAMRSASVRAQILEDLRDSPFESHAIELSSYLRGARGNAIVDTAAALLGVSRGHILSTLGPTSGSALELIMPRYGDRRNWGGTPNIAVVGVSESPTAIVRRAVVAHVNNIAGYDIAGRPVDIYLHGPGAVPYLLVAPAQRSFGSSPEIARAQAPRRGETTIGEPDERIMQLTGLRPRIGIKPLIVCGPPDCGGGGGGGTAGPGYLVLPSGQTYAQCVNFVSYETINTTCRSEIAWAFRPRPIFNSDEGCKLRSPYWAARTDGTSIAIYYAISYERDCNNRSGYSDSHNGDSEFIIVRVTEDPAAPGHWRLANVTLSAHYMTFADRTWTGSPPAIEFHPYENLIRPMVYIAWGKHSNYRDVGSCGRGGYGFDDCGANADNGEELGITAGATNDLGFRSAQVHNCVGAPFANGSFYQECYWSYATLSIFTGWHGANPGATSYTTLLSDFGY